VSTSTIGGLGIKWVFPVPESPPPFTGQGAEGVVASPLIANGVAYVLTNWNELYALNAGTGTVLWQQAVPISSINSTNYRCGNNLVGCGVSVGSHIHNGQWAYTSTIFGKTLVWVSTVGYQVFAYDALTGTQFLNFTWFSPYNKVTGNFGVWDPGSSNMIMIDEKRGILTVGTENIDCQCEARGFVTGWNLLAKPVTQMWGPTFLMPPQDGSDPNWSINSVGNMTNAWIFNGTGAVNLKTLPASTLHSVLYNDWGNTGFNGTRSYSGLGVNWGGPWGLDPATGNVIVSTSQPPIDYNSTYRPGPNLWSDSILSLNDQTGKWNWGFQTVPHDIWDQDCSWGTILANVTIAGAQQLEVIKGCKNGILYGLNAATGAMNWFFNAPSTKHINEGPADKFTNGYHNPLNSTHMTLDKWPGYPKQNNITSPYIVTCKGTGCIESDPAYDPTSGTVFVATWNNLTCGYSGNTGPRTAYTNLANPTATFCTAHNPNTMDNTTIWALNSATGKPLWSHFLGNYGYRGGLTVSGGLVYVVTPDGGISFLSETTGAVSNTVFLGAPSIVQPAVATDPNGNTVVVIPGSATTSPYGKPSNAGNVPGVVMGLELANPGAATTVTSTAPATTVTSTAPGSGVTVTSTAPGVTVTAPGVTVTSTASGGGNSTTLYGVAAVAVIFIIATGFFAMRGRKPAS